MTNTLNQLSFEEDIMPKLYDIPEYKLDKFLAKIDFLAKKCKKFNLPVITVKEISCNKITQKILINQEYVKVTYTSHTFELSGDSPIISGWRFIAKLEHLESGNVIFSMAEDTLPEIYR